MAFGVYQPPFRAKKTGTGFTNLQTYLQANKDNRLGQTLSSGIQNTAQQARQQIGQSSSQFQQQAQQSRLDTDVNRQKIGEVLGRFSSQTQPSTQPTQGQAQTQQTAQQPTQPTPPATGNQVQAQSGGGTLNIQPVGEVGQAIPTAPVGDDRATAAQSTAAATPLVSDEEMKEFEKFRTGTYAGPTQLQNAGSLLGTATEAEQLGLGVGSETGRLGLLQRFAAKPQQQYGLGQQRLDQLLLGGSTPQLQQARRSALGLTGEAQRAAETAAAMGSEYTNLARQFGQETLGRIGETEKPISTDLDTYVQEAQASEKARQQAMADIKDLLIGRGTQDVIDQQTGKVIRKGGGAITDEAEARKQALTMAASAGLLSVDEINRIGDMARQLQTPIERMITQRVEGGSGGILGYAGAKPGETFTYSATPITSSLKLNQLLQEYLQGQEASNITRSGLISEDQKRKLNTLAQLAGKQQEFTQESPRYQSGLLGWDFDKMQEAINRDIARLRNEELTAPTIYNEVPLSEKLRATFLPTAEEMKAQQASDMSKLTSSDTGLDSRAGALARMYYGTAPRLASVPIGKEVRMVGESGLAAPLSQGITGGLENQLETQKALSGVLTETARPVLDKVGLGQALDAVSKLESIISTPVVKAAEGFRRGVGGIIEKIPVVNTISNAISGIFCYAEGTEIKMKDGSWKKVEDIQVDEECFLGGTVTGTGETKTPYIYEYKDQLVEGNHAVFEDGKFIRVQDSQFGTKYKNTLDIRLVPLVNKNHLVVTRTHIGADLLEIDQSQGLSEDKRLKELNKNKDLLDLLDKYDKMIYHENKKI